MIKSVIQAGACGHRTVVRAESRDGENVDLLIESECPDIQKMAASLQRVDAFEAVSGKMTDSPVYRLAAEHCAHASCAVPMGILKSIEAACSRALPQDVSVSIEQED